jgi:hypothetical protein
MKGPRCPMPDQRFTACRARAHAAEEVEGDPVWERRRAAALVRLLERALESWPEQERAKVTPRDDR